MTWVVASAHGLMVPLCQIHSGYCMSATRDGRPIILPEGRWRAAHRIYSTIHQHPMWRRRPNVVREGEEPLDSVCPTRSATGPLRLTVAPGSSSGSTATLPGNPPPPPTPAPSGVGPPPH